MIRRVAAFVRLGRPIFLTGGFVLYGLGAAVAAHAGAVVHWRRFGWGQAAITAIQLMTHYSNDYFDLEADRANRTPTRWSGGSRVLPGGELPPSVALAAALALAAFAAGAIAFLRSALDATAAAIGMLLAAMGLAWGYSAPPLRLAARGAGEITTAIVVTGLTPLVGFALQTGGVAATPLLAIAPLACLQTAMLISIELPDAAGDEATGKRTLVVRIGARAAARLYVAIVIAAYAMLPALALAGLPVAVAVAMGATAPLAAIQVIRFARGSYRDPARWGALALGAVALLVAASAAELAAFVALTLIRGG